MKKMRWLSTVGIVLAGLLPVCVMGQSPVITSFQGNGLVTWTNAVNTSAIYRMEWASRAGGPWRSFTYQPMNTIDAHDSTTFKVEVPMFYRVVMVTNEPAQGMVWIDGGDVELGQVGIAGPVHTNFVSGFWIDEMKVTKAKWDEVYQWAVTNGYQFDYPGSGKALNHPVQTVDWYHCVRWCNARSQKEGLTPCYYTSTNLTAADLYTNGVIDVSNEMVNWSANGYRLATEAEWEKAARGGRQGRLFPWGGDTIQHGRANYFSTNAIGFDTSTTRGYHPLYDDGVEPYTSPVGSFPANGYGLHDMAGNVFEWCWDWYGAYTTTYESDPHGPPSGEWRTFRCGSWQQMGYAWPARCAQRNVNGWPLNAWDGIGFRCVRGR